MDSIKKTLMNKDRYGTYYSVGGSKSLDTAFKSPVISRLPRENQDNFTQCFDIYWQKFPTVVEHVLDFGFVALPTPFTENLINEINSSLGDEIITIRKKWPMTISIQNEYELKDSWETIKNAVFINNNVDNPTEEVEIDGGFKIGSYYFHVDFKNNLSSSTEKKIGCYLIHHIVRMSSLYENWNSNKECIERFYTKKALNHPLNFISEINNKEVLAGFNLVRILSEVLITEQDIKTSLDCDNLKKFSRLMGNSVTKQTAIILGTNRISKGKDPFIKIPPEEFVPVVRSRGSSTWEIVFGLINKTNETLFVRNSKIGSSQSIVAYGISSTIKMLTIEEFLEKAKENKINVDYFKLLELNDKNYIPNNAETLIEYMKKNPELYEKEREKLNDLSMRVRELISR